MIQKHSLFFNRGCLCLALSMHEHTLSFWINNHPTCPIMRIAMWCIWATHTAAVPPEASAAEPSEAAASASASLMVMAPTSELFVYHVTTIEVIPEFSVCHVTTKEAV